MSVVRPIIAEFQQEVVATRRLLERVPEEHFDWRPHAKSMTLRELASHIVDSFSWLESIVRQDELVMDPATFEPWLATSREHLLDTFDRNVDAAIAVLESQPDDVMLADWAMKLGERTVFAAPRIAVVRMFTLGHHIHHRGQLDVYLRLKDVPLPQIYGPTADEPDMAPVD